MAQHEIDKTRLPYAPEKLPRKPDVEVADFFAVDLRAGRVVAVEEFPEARKPACADPRRRRRFRSADRVGDSLVPSP